MKEEAPANPAEAQVSSPSYLLAVEDTQFLLRDELRAVRFALEYSKADLLLRDWGIRSTSSCSAVRECRLRSECRRGKARSTRSMHDKRDALHLAMRANALVIFPGGFGTMDELFELLTLQQTNKAPDLPIVLFGSEYWRQLVNFELLLEEGMISQQDFELFEFADSAEQTWEILTRRGLRAHS